MADIFLSYARADQPIAERIATALEAAGHSVWWDQHLHGGHDFSEDIEREIAAARAVLVLWSQTSVKSHWVRDEASYGQREHKLIPASIDGTEPPMGYRQLHTIAADSKNPEALVAAVGAFLSGETPRPAPTTTKPAKPKRKMPAWGIIGIVAVAVAGATGFLNPDRWDKILGLDEEQVASAPVSLAVMPFDVLGDAGDDYMGPGMAGAINTSLSNIAGLSLTANSSATALAGEALTVQQLGERLGVTHIIEGQIQPRGDTLQIDVSLVDAASGRQLWSQNYSGARDTTPLLTSEITSDIAAAMQARLGIGQGRLADLSDVEPAALEAYLRGIEALSTRYDGENRLEAYEQFDRAASIDPDFAAAHAGLAYMISLSLPREVGLTAEQHARLRVEATDRALDLDPGNLLARSAQAHFMFASDGDIEAALNHTSDILSDAPDFGPAHYARAGALNMGRDYRAALSHMRQALDRDPFNRTLQSVYADMLIDIGNYPALRAFVRQCDGCPNLSGVWPAALGLIGTQTDFDTDWAELRRLELRNGMPEPILDGLEEMIRAILAGERFEIPGFMRDPPSFNLATLFAVNGQYQDVLDTLPRAVESRYPIAIMEFGIRDRSRLPEEVRADPRYHALFESPPVKKTMEYLRPRGHTENLPVFPVKPYEGP